MRAYSTLEIKSVDTGGDKRTFTGIASTPTADRSGDIVEPRGAKFKLPIPLLWQHNSEKPIGWVTSATVTAKGIEIAGEVADIPDDGPLKQRLLEAWQSIQAKLVRGLSIGFNPIESAQIDGTWGVHYLAWEWLELSAVTIAANQDASITAIKAADTRTRAALGLTRKSVVRLVDPPGVSGNHQTKPASSGLFVAPKGHNVKTIQEQIAAFEAKRASTAAQLSEIVNKSLESGETLDADEKQKHADLKSEIREIDDHIVMLKDSESLMLKTAEVVKPRQLENPNDGSSVRGNVIVHAPAKLDKGIAFSRFVSLLATNKGNATEALKVARDVYPNETALHSVLKMVDSTPRNFLQKTAVDAGTTVGTTWAAPLTFYQNMVNDFIEFLRPQTIIGRIPNLRKVPFKVSVPRQTTGGSAYWVGEGAPKPLTSLAFDRVTLDITKIATIAVLTDELARLSTPAAEAITRDQLAAAIIQQMDTDFVDPANAGSAAVKPASITNGVTPVSSAGNSETNVRADIQSLFRPWITNNVSAQGGVWIMNVSTALALSLMVNGLGQPSFPGITMDGGTFFGMPVIVSEAAGLLSGTTGGIVILAKASDILLADDGQVTVDASGEASLEMLTNPTNNSATATPTTMVSMFQTNSLAIRAERYINWVKGRSTAVQYMSGVHWGQ